MNVRASTRRLWERTNEYAKAAIRAVKGAGNTIVFVAAVIGALVAIHGYLGWPGGSRKSAYSGIYERLTDLTIGGPIETLISQLGEPDFVQPWSLGADLGLGPGSAPKDARGSQDEWVIRSHGKPVALVVALTNQADNNQVGLLEFIALVRSFTPTFHTFAVPSEAITLNRSRIADITPAAVASVGDAMPASEPGYYLESNCTTVPHDGTPANLVGDSFGSQPVPYALIERLAAEHLSFLNFGANGSIDAPNGEVPTASVLDQPAVRRLREAAVIDTYGLVNGCPGQYGSWNGQLLLPSGEQF
jgi:hypothetical protein